MLGHQAGQGLRETARALGGPCAVCRQWGLDAVCASCLQLHAKPRPRCRRCAEPLAFEGLCAECTADPPPFLRTHVAVDYGFPWDRLIADLKFGGEAATLKAFAFVEGDLGHRLRADAQRGNGQCVFENTVHVSDLSLLNCACPSNASRALRRIVPTVSPVPMPVPSGGHRIVS